MIGLDTNILVRYLVADDKRQFEAAKGLIEKEEEMFVSVIVFCEMVWVLESCYKFQSIDLIEVLQKMLSTRQLIFERSELLWKVVEAFAEDKVDLSDCLIGLIHQSEGCDYTVTFEKALKKLPTFRILE